MRALIIDDDSSWRDILEEILTDEGFEVDSVRELEALGPLLQSQSYRLAVVDLSLGGPDHTNQEGLKALELLERHAPLCNSVLLTGFATVELAVDAINRYHAATCLRKESFSRADFRKLVHNLKAQLPRPAEAVGRTRTIGPLALLVEDDAGWRSLLTELLEEADYQVLSCVSYGEAVTFLKRQSAALAVLDLQLANSAAPDDNQDGLGLLELTTERSIPTIIVSGTMSASQIDGAMTRYGVLGFLEKEAFARLLSQLSRAVALTEREREVLQLLVSGLNNADIGEKLFVSTNTVKQHLKTIFEKLGVHNRAAAVAWATGASGAHQVPLKGQR